MTDLLKTLGLWLSEGKPVASATIVTHEGSTPRSAGSKMIVRPGGEMFGTVGGGLVEARVLQAAARVLGDGVPVIMDFDLTGELAAGADMVCGGKLRVFLERIEPGAEAALYAELLRRVEQGERVLLAVPMGGGPRALIPARGDALGARLPQGLLEGALQAGKDIRAPVVFEALEERWFLEPWAGPSPLYIAGAGHVSRPTARVASMTGFRVTVMDDRPEFANRNRFPEAHEIIVEDMRACLQDKPIGPDASVVIVTRGHAGDADVLAQALRTQAGYIGMIGSRRKRDSVYGKLRAQGFTDADFDRVRCPIGLDIGAETPEEIAVSILAELIQARAARGAA
ncbi:XdhC family aldehyde oxidoreductase maturation factor [Fundidesulfovibrio soli]|uniref:XdhC family aldehyde oxidoreductase maturation factor n=1 Tax=Fundidesulfovibrio soli TaxID=2922716 RepID=UPI001FB02319|nr:XdhC/CoxI family protein [Fundidesulfovibrio soli]